MNLLPMRYYLAVAKNKGISSAAKELFITQQTLSTHIAAMEKELDCVLFERKPAFHLTEEGKSFYTYCEKMVALDEQMHREFADRKKEPTGVIRIGISQTRSRLMMPLAALRWQKKYPGVRLYITEMNNEQLIQAALEGKIEVGIGNIHEEIPELQVESLHQEKLMLLIPLEENYRELIKEWELSGNWQCFSQYPFILHTNYDIVGRFGSRFFEEHGMIPQIAVKSDNAETCLDMCRAGIGLYICPDMFLKKMDISEKFYTIPLNIEYTISTAYRKKTYQSRLIEEFIQILKQR